MSEINVTANTDKAWKKNYGIFKRKFLGTTKNGEACTILNEFVLSFSKSDKIFRAQASQPLQIENPDSVTKLPIFWIILKLKIK